MINNTNILTNDRHNYVEGLWVVTLIYLRFQSDIDVVVNSQKELLLTCS